MKNKPDIQDLLDRYWEGETTLEEERRLKEFFATEPVPDRYRQEAALFRALRSEQSLQMPAGREMSIAPRPSYRLGWAAAASVVLLLSAGIWWLNHQPLTPGSPVAQVMPQPKAVEEPAPTAAIPEKEKIAQTAPLKAEMPRKRFINRPPSAAKQDFGSLKNFQNPELQDTYEDPEQALEEIKAVLALVSNKINKGKKEIGKGLQEVEAVDILFKKKKEISG